MFYADTLGLAKVLEGIRKYEREQGARYWTPAKRLVELANSNRRFSE
jgi:hypothetical protein